MAKARGNRARTKRLIEVGIGNLSFKFSCTYLVAMSAKNMKARIMKADISDGICSTNLKVSMYKLPPPARRILYPNLRSDFTKLHMKKPIDMAQSPKARSRSTTILLIQAMIPVPNEAMISIKVQFPELNIASVLMR